MEKQDQGRDWYDFVWFAANHPQMHLFHLEQRMRQTGHWEGTSTITPQDFFAMLTTRISRINIDQARREVEPFVKNTESLTLWSKDFSWMSPPGSRSCDGVVLFRGSAERSSPVAEVVLLGISAHVGEGRTATEPCHWLLSSGLRLGFITGAFSVMVIPFLTASRSERRSVAL